MCSAHVFNQTTARFESDALPVENDVFFCVTTQLWRSQPKNFGGAKMFDFRRITLFCLEKRLLKQKMTIFSKMFGGGMAPLAPLVTPMPPLVTPIPWLHLGMAPLTPLVTP